MNLLTLSVFAECVARGSFAGAARGLDLDPSQVSRMIAGLEADLRLRLFERSTRRITLTEAGALYHKRIAPLLAEIDDAGAAARDLSDAPKGRLRVAASTAFGERVIVPMLKGFLETHREIDIDLVLSDAQVDLLEARIDVAVRLAPDAPPDTIVSKLCQTRYVVAAHPAFAKKLTRPEDLTDIPVVCFAYPGFRDLWRFRKAGKVTEVPISGRLEITGAAAVLSAARQGVGPALLADWLVQEDFATGRRVEVFPKHDVTATAFDTSAWVLTPSRRYQPLKARVFIDALRRHVENQFIHGEISNSVN
ncbi:MAG: LysR family transcriptional regulator [Pseudomonadota bacterium]